MRSEQIFNKLAHAPLADGSVEAVIHKLVKADGHFFVHRSGRNVVRITNRGWQIVSTSLGRVAFEVSEECG